MNKELELKRVNNVLILFKASRGTTPVPSGAKMLPDISEVCSKRRNIFPNIFCYKRQNYEFSLFNNLADALIFLMIKIMH